MARRVTALSADELDRLTDEQLHAYLAKVAPEIVEIERRRLDLYDARRSAMWLLHQRGAKQADVARSAGVGTQAVAFQLHKARKDAVAAG